MAWPTKEWWRRAFAGIDARVREQFRRDVSAQDRARSEREQADEKVRIAAVLRGRVDGETITKIYWED
jgi:hypothetical protein